MIVPIGGELLPEWLMTENGHQPWEVAKRPECGEECLEIHPRGAPGVAEPHGTVERESLTHQKAAGRGELSVG
jgi:hypothetical protein